MIHVTNHPHRARDIKIAVLHRLENCYALEVFISELICDCLKTFTNGSGN